MKDQNDRDVVVRGLKAALAAHHEGRVFDIGDARDDAAAVDHDDSRISIALTLWEGWADSAAHQWRYYDRISADDWPRFANLVIEALEHDRAIVDPELLEHFVPRAREPSALSRFVVRIKALFGSV